MQIFKIPFSKHITTPFLLPRSHRSSLGLMMSSTFNSNTQERNWLELPFDVAANIFKRVGIADILDNVQNVCTVWRNICTNDPTMWRVIDMRSLLDLYAPELIEDRCKRLVDRSQGQLVDIVIVDADDDEFLLYVSRRSSQLRRLVIGRGDYYIGRSLTKVLINFPLLEELGLYHVHISKEIIESAAHNCPMLRTLKVNQVAYKNGFEDNNDEIAIAIGENLGELRHLEVIGNKMSTNGLETILDGCRHLETIDLRMCLYIDLEGDIGKRCNRQIKVVKPSQESHEAYLMAQEEDDFYFDPDVYDSYISR